MGTGSGKGKSILFGEHFVVYGLPAIAAGISSETIANVTRKSTPGWTLKDDRPAMPGYKEKKADEQKVSIDNVIRYLKLDTSREGFHIDLGGDLVCASGIGASAASCVAIARALNDEYSLGLDDEAINQAAYEGEKGYHGTPSGIDNTASTFGGLVWFVRDLQGGPPLFDKLKLERDMQLVIASTGITASTIEVVGDVRKKKEEDPKWFDSVAERYDRLVHDAKDALLQLDGKRVGQLMNENHDLLQQLTVSCDELDHLVEVAREKGALGSKMTGTGRGGNMIALAPDETTANAIAGALEKAGAAAVWRTTFGL
ncbi:MAG: mevalonate kinase [Candidatus Thorarchaeota archaeon]|nr:MAG: mevalonate kinase [Candidatus Thorarchaeota archaeon]RLI60263.1 MAG: mevalonate kinase [Candidatus Thorarchaeota archaeon]